MTPSQLLQAVEGSYKLRAPLFVWGPPGIGKSDVMRQAAEKLKIDLIDKRLAQSDPTEIKGYPWPDQAKKVMRFFQDASLPTKGKGILFLDELPHAPPAVQAVAFQLVLDRKVGDYTLPDGWQVIAAGNRVTDRAGAHTINSALANRFVHVELTVDNEEWIDWAIANKLDPLTIGYIRYRPENLCVAEIKPGEKAFNTPRSWARADQIMRLGLDEAVQRQMLCGTLGEGVGTEFVGYCKAHADLVSIDRILMAPEDAPLPENTAATYAVVSVLERETTRGNIGRLQKYTNRLSREFQTVYMEAITRSKPELCETPEYIAWVRANRDAVMG